MTRRGCLLPIIAVVGLGKVVSTTAPDRHAEQVQREQASVDRGIAMCTDSIRQYAHRAVTVSRTQHLSGGGAHVIAHWDSTEVSCIADLNGDVMYFTPGRMRHGR